MNTQFKESFLKDLRAIKDRDSLARINEVIKAVEKAQTPQEIPNLKKLRGERNYFRIRIGDYRLGLWVASGVWTFAKLAGGVVEKKSSHLAGSAGVSPANEPKASKWITEKEET